jgi:O-acetyl-ADP-ribose deacetylase (regulator of RNase III)
MIIIFWQQKMSEDLNSHCVEKIQIIKGDITKIEVDAVVNAANSSLLGGGGVDGAIHRAGGPDILEACRKIVARQGGCKTGEAVITTAGNLPAKYVIHTVGPVWNGGTKQENEKLKNCYINSLKLAAEYGCKTIAFPNISTGVYGFPKDKAAIIALNAVKEFLAKNNNITQVFFVCFDEENFNLLKINYSRENH